MLARCSPVPLLVQATVPVALLRSRERGMPVGAWSVEPWAAGPPPLSPTPHRMSMPAPALLLGFCCKPSEHCEEACLLASFGRGREEQGLRSAVQLSVGFGALCAPVTRAMADSPPEVGFGSGLIWVFGWVLFFL